MLTVDKAIELISTSVDPLTAEMVRLSDALGHTLAADIISGLDSPPFGKALMDGFAVRSSDCESAGAKLGIIEEVTAGRVAEKRVESGTAIQIMTGAPMPDGADAVVPVEQTTVDEQTVRINVAVNAGANILNRGASISTGQKVLSAGTRIRPQEVGLLAELGCHTVSVRPRPRVAILATGDELAPIHEEPGPGQIRNSNEAMLTAQIANADGESVPLGIARDNAEHISLGISLGLQADMLVLSGGVSAGKLDLVPAELEKAGVRQIFHKVNVKPGKPLWFGICETDDRVTPVFGLPGNPVSSMVCFELFVRAAMSCMVGSKRHSRRLMLPLAKGVRPNRTRPTYHPARLSADGSSVEPIDWVGSADLRCTVDASGVALLPAGEAELSAGTVVEYTSW